MEPTNHGSRRVRTRKACLPCSRRKRKCNGDFPCDVCVGYGYECGYRPGTSQTYTRPHRPQSRFQSGRYGSTGAERSSGDVEGTWTPMNAASSSTAMTERVHESNNGLLVVSSSRYLGRYSAEAFPRFLALQMQTQLLPKLQPFAWNLNERPKPSPGVKGAIRSLITLDAAQHQIRSFFLLDFPASACLNLDVLLARCESHWQGHNQGLTFEAVVSGLIGLTAVLGHTLSSRQETCIVEHAEKILNDPAVLGEATIEVLVALVLRYLYLRATATPQATWLVICTTMHMAESFGLHKQYSPGAGRDQYSMSGWNDDTRSLLFWLISAGNRLSSHELGRTPVVLQGVTRVFPFSASDTSTIATFCRVAHLLPLVTNPENSDDEHKHFSESLGKITSIQIDQPFLKLITADVCFILYRRIRVSANQHITKQEVQQVVAVGREAVHAARQLVQERKPWWNILSTLFQFCCTLISMDSTDSLADLNSVISTINLVRGYYPGEDSAEAVATLNTLIGALRQKKQSEIDCLNWGGIWEGPMNAKPDIPIPAERMSPEPILDDFQFTFEDLDWMSSDLLMGQ